MIAERIKSMREQRDMTQTELARRLGITRSSVNAWEMGISIPSTQYVVELARLFKVSTDYLLGVSASVSVNVSGLSEADIRMVNALIDHLRSRG